jgi:glycosyltransferase involved in cell wall biosynthesis
MFKIAYVTNAPPQSGMGRPARAIRALLPAEKFTIDEFMLDGARGELQKNGKRSAAKVPLPGPLAAKPVQWWRLARHLPRTGYDLWHFTNQSLSFIPRRPAVITVYDLIELISPQEQLARLAYRYLYRGIPDVAHIMCISNYTKQTVQKLYSVPDNKISVVPLAVSAHFTRLPNARESVAYQTFLLEHKLTPRHKIILYVGSEHPRKNLSTLVAAFASVRQNHPEAVLVKVGEPGLAAGRARLLADLDDHGVRQHTRLIGNLNDDDLRFMYSIADVFVFPSTFEGFGLPPLEAMACGCPTVASKATSVPEVIGDGGLLCDPSDSDAFAADISRILSQPALARDLSRRGQQRAAQFTWQRAAAQTSAVYHRVLEAHARRQPGAAAGPGVF